MARTVKELAAKPDSLSSLPEPARAHTHMHSHTHTLTYMHTGRPQTISLNPGLSGSGESALFQLFILHLPLWRPTFLPQEI